VSGLSPWGSEDSDAVGENDRWPVRQLRLKRLFGAAKGRCGWRKGRLACSKVESEEIVQTGKVTKAILIDHPVLGIHENVLIGSTWRI
jgi:hypothetical protein